MITRYNVTENHDGMGFSNGMSLDDNGDYVSHSDYEKLKRAYDALAEDMTAAQGQIADAQKLLGNGVWQPIKTAPKDGTIFDVWLSVDDTCNDAPKRIANCRYENDELQYLHSHGWFPVFAFYQKRIVTHWAPLTPPPRTNT